MLADDHVARFDVAVKHAAAVSILEGVAHVDKPAQQVRSSSERGALALERLVGVKSLDRLLEAAPLINRIA